MTKTASTMLPLGVSLPYFNLPVINAESLESENNYLGQTSIRVTSKEFKNKPLLLMVICAHCPFVKHVEKEITNLQNDYLNLIELLAISSNSLKTHPQDNPQNLSNQAKQNSWFFPYAFDEDQSLAKALNAACTPDFFLFAPSSKEEQLLVYRGQLDDSRPGNDLLVTGRDIRNAIDALLKFQPISSVQKPSIGCNIKWHPGEEPS